MIDPGGLLAPSEALDLSEVRDHDPEQGRRPEVPEMRLAQRRLSLMCSAKIECKHGGLAGGSA